MLVSWVRVGCGYKFCNTYTAELSSSCHRSVSPPPSPANRNGNAATTGAADCSSCGPSVCRVGLEIDKSARQDRTGRDRTIC